MSTIKEKRSHALKAVAVLSVLSLAASGCGLLNNDGGNDGDGGASSLQRVVDSGELRFAAISDSAPAYFKDGDEFLGYCAEIARKIAEDLGLEPVPVESSWANMALDLQADKIDIATCAQPTGERSLVVDYTTHPVYTNYYSLVVRDQSLNTSSWTDLNSKDVTIGAVAGDATIEPVQQYAPEAKIVTYDTEEQAFLALQNGQIDAKAQALVQALRVAAQRADVGLEVAVPDPLIAAPSAVMLRRQSDTSLLRAVDVVVWNLQSSGFNRDLIMKGLESEGVSAEDLPDNAQL